jgi:hypothetical protein
MASTLSQNEARTVAAMVATCDGADAVVAAMAEEARREHGRWDEDRAVDVLLARIELNRQIEAAGVEIPA